jgi:hypothetical protein
MLLAIRLRETTICPGGDVEGLVPLAFCDVCGAGAVDGVEGGGGVEGEGVGCDADDRALWSSG